ncbi:MAG: Rieske (2Fe-2S) protein [Chloroflexota bacterium]|nr:Rieske (2Fe-2S) protein [Chloroflexota bacterium]
MTIITRRDFLKGVKSFLAATGLAALFGPVLAYFYPPSLDETPPDPVLVAPMGELSVGEGKKVSFGRYPALVINTSEGLKAYSAVCTHFACICKWDPDLGQIVCPCHDGFFDPLDGSVISGPPPTPLATLNVEIVDGDIYVSVGGEA